MAKINDRKFMLLAEELRFCRKAVDEQLAKLANDNERGRYVTNVCLKYLGNGCNVSDLCKLSNEIMPGGRPNYMLWKMIANNELIMTSDRKIYRPTTRRLT